ncbi:MAG: excinuclease ABC subunit UvrC [Dehalococcoidia bacterium]|nr:excinuclease ABC subunit UvrC [Dehalococcoidia bacterium]
MWLEEQLRVLPANPGVYLFKDEKGRVIYVGKATNLNNRVRSYFGTSNGLSSKIQQLVLKVRELEFIITGSEQEALILECDLIKKYHPKYNVSLKDGKTFPYLKITVNEDWPGIYITRCFENDGAKYFGPFASADSVRKTLRLIKKIFPFRSCTKAITGTAGRPCLDYYIHHCLGPCVGAVSKQEYQKVIKQVILFLEGKQELICYELKNKMRTAVKQSQFEKAALLRDQIQAIEKIMEGQRIAITLKGEQDIVALAQDERQACVEIFSVRNSKLVGRKHFIMEGTCSEEPDQVMTNFVKQYYASASFIPSLILLQHPVWEMALLSEWLKQRKGNNVTIRVPKRGIKRKLVNMVAENADRSLLLARTRWVNLESITSGLHELKDKLSLPQIPLRIEGYDISDIGGALAVGSMVVLKKGLPEPNLYRRFQVKMVTGANDYAMIQEILRRRFKRSVAGGSSWAVMPDLILIDGGKGHLNAALEVRQELGIDFIPMVSLAKENEDVFMPGKSDSLDMPNDSPALHILQRARNEAHRFAIRYHRELRRKEGIASILDAIPDIGLKRKRALMKKFGSVEAIKKASVAEIWQTETITLILARKIKQYL